MKKLILTVWAVAAGLAAQAQSNQPKPFNSKTE